MANAFDGGSKPKKKMSRADQAHLNKLMGIDEQDTYESEKDEYVDSLQSQINETSTPEAQEEVSTLLSEASDREDVANREAINKRRIAAGMEPLPDPEDKSIEEVVATTIIEQEPEEAVEEKDKSIEDKIKDIGSAPAPTAVKEAKSTIASLFEDEYHQNAWNVIEGKRDSDMAKLDSEQQGQERRAAIAKILKDLISAAALMHAANKGIQGDIQLGDNAPEMEAAMSRIQRRIDGKRKILQSKYGRAADLFASQERRKRQVSDRAEDDKIRKDTRDERESTRVQEKNESIERSEKNRTESRETAQATRDAAEGRRQRKDMVDLRKAYKVDDDSEDLAAELEVQGFSPDRADELAGVVDYWFDGEPDWKTIKEEMAQLGQPSKASPKQSPSSDQPDPYWVKKYEDGDMSPADKASFEKKYPHLVK